MGHPVDDGPAPSTTVTYPPVLSVLARDHRSQWQEKAGDQVSRVRGSLAEHATFGPNPTAARFASVYEAARAEYADTVNGIRADLLSAADNLARPADEMRRRDENAGEAFVGLLARWATPEGFESHRRQEEAEQSDEVVAGAATMADLDAPIPPSDATDPTDPTGPTDPTDDTGPTDPTSPGDVPSPTMTTGEGS